VEQKYQYVVGIGLFLFVFGAWSLLAGWHAAAVAPREATTVGIINEVHSGKGSYYKYSYRVDGVTYSSNDSSCQTPLFHGMCEVGSMALVYYDRAYPDLSQLNEYGAESRTDFRRAQWMTPVGALLLLGTFVVLRRIDHLAREVDVAENDYDEQAAPEVLHVVPTDKS
jgi:hypothetical protein